MWNYSTICVLFGLVLVLKAENFHMNDVEGNFEVSNSLHSEGRYKRDVNPKFATIPERFREHPGNISLKFDTQLLFCNFAAQTCYYNSGPMYVRLWVLRINSMNYRINNTGHTATDDMFRRVALLSPRYNGPRCLLFSTYTNTSNLNFVIIMRTKDRDVIIGEAGNQLSARKISVGLNIRTPYRIIFRIYPLGVHRGLPEEGLAIIEKLAILVGPCPEDRPSLNCTFDDNFCRWRQRDVKHIWYRVPFGLHKSIEHKIEWGALSAFKGKGRLFSPLVRIVNARCFSFVYVKAESTESFLKVWLLYRIPGRRDTRVKLFEDVSNKKVLKRRIDINIFQPYDFQIAFEGRSKNIIHGVVVLETSLTTRRCKGFGRYMNLKRRQFKP